MASSDKMDASPSGNSNKKFEFLNLFKRPTDESKPAKEPTGGEPEVKGTKEGKSETAAQKRALAKKQAKAAQDKDRKDIVPRVQKVRKDMELVVRCNENIKKAYDNLLRTEFDLLTILNRTRRHKICSIHELKLPEWQGLVKDLTASASEPEIRVVFTGLRDHVYLAIARVVDACRCELRTIADQADKRYFDIRDPTWLESEAHILKCYSDKTREQVKSQTTHIVDWLRDNLGDLVGLTKSAGAKSEALKQELGINDCCPSDKELATWVAADLNQQQNSIRLNIEELLDTDQRKFLEMSTYLEKWQKVRGAMAVAVWKQFDLHLETLLEQCIEDVEFAHKRFPELKEGE